MITTFNVAFEINYLSTILVLCFLNTKMENLIIIFNLNDFKKGDTLKAQTFQIKTQNN